MSGRRSSGSTSPRSSIASRRNWITSSVSLAVVLMSRLLLGLVPPDNSSLDPRSGSPARSSGAPSSSLAGRFDHQQSHFDLQRALSRDGNDQRKAAAQALTRIVRDRVHRYRSGGVGDRTGREPRRRGLKSALRAVPHIMGRSEERRASGQ